MVRRSLRPIVAAAAIATVTLALGGCGSSSNNNAGATTAGTNSTGQPATVGVANTGLGNILVDSQGRTLYLFEKDTGKTSMCTGSCTTFWPPLTVTGTPTAGNDATASLIGTTTRSDGKTQVTYNGHPVYLYTGDHQAGDTTGEGLVAFGASWFALSSAGDKVSAPVSSSGGGNGY